MALPPPAVTGRNALAWAGLALAALIVYVTGLLPAPAQMTVDHCYVTFDRMEEQHSRCVGHWRRVGVVISGPIHGVPVGMRWQALTTDPDANHKWEVEVPEASRRHDGLVILFQGWAVSRTVQALVTAVAVVNVGLLCWVVAPRLRRRQRSRGESV